MAIYGVGTDLCDIRRVAETLARRGDRFAERVLGEREIVVFRARRERSEPRGLRFLATRFSAKESFSKAIGLGIHHPMRWRDCEILNRPGGQPYVHLSGELAAWCRERRLRAHVSVTDERDYASSVVVVECDDPPTALPAAEPPAPE